MTTADYVQQCSEGHELWTASLSETTPLPDALRAMLAFDRHSHECRACQEWLAVFNLIVPVPFTTTPPGQ